MSNYELFQTTAFEKSVKKLYRKDLSIKQGVIQTLTQLESDPFYPGLRTHKVNLSDYGSVWSSTVIKNKLSGDLRILWDFDSENNKIIILIMFGTHDEVY